MTRTVTEKDQDRSYVVMALLDVTAAATDYLADEGLNQQPARLAGNIAAVLRHINELVGETHGSIEFYLRDREPTERGEI
ncbi:hypothetical protein ACEQ6A_11400 [Rhizobium brockwellii]|uniref:hypothetical protein n=1 Tax=Rhizobium brockwellii TaxID=3019932 RepID=UPI003F9DE51F